MPLNVVFIQVICSVILATTSDLVSDRATITESSGTVFGVSVNSSSANTTGMASTTVSSVPTTENTLYILKCFTNDSLPCENLSVACLDCTMNHYCAYGSSGTANCTVKPNITCTGIKTFQRSYFCLYSYQLERKYLVCAVKDQQTCSVKSAPPATSYVDCKVNENVLCLGNRSFIKKIPCTWTSGYKWSTALVLSVTLGGFGIDRFYLGLWREGIGKLFSFGGLGVWTIVDVILIATSYVGPYDGSLYIYPWSWKVILTQCLGLS